VRALVTTAAGLVVFIYMGLRRIHARQAAEINSQSRSSPTASWFPEVQRELRGSKPKSRGTEIEKFTTWGVAPRKKDEDEWKLFVEAFVLDSPVIGHGHHAGKWLSTGRVHWAPVPSKSLGWGFSELHHQTGGCQDYGWKVWEAPGTTIEAEAHRQLACSAYASPSKVYSVRGHEGRMVPLTMYVCGQSEICNLGLRKRVQMVVAQSLHSPFRLQGWGVQLHLFLTGSSGVLRVFLAFEGPFWGFCYEIISWRA
jgi:hypothetical protein